MKTSLKFLTFLVVICSIPTQAALSPESQILLDNEKAGISYVVPTGYSNMGTFEGVQPYTLLYSQIDFEDSFPHEFRVYTISTPETVNKFKNIKTNKQAELLFTEIVSKSSNQKFLSASVKTIGNEKFVIVDMLRSNSEKTLHIQVAHVYKNNKLHVVEFIDNTESYLKYTATFESFLRSFKVKDFSKYNKPVIGKRMTVQGSASVLLYNLPEGYFPQFIETDNIYLSNARNQSIGINKSEGSFYIKDIFSAQTNANLVEIVKNTPEFTQHRTETGAGNNYFLNAYIKTYGGQKMYIIEYNTKFVDSPTPEEKVKSVYMYRNGTFYTVSFRDLDTFNDSEVEELLKSIKIKDTKKVPVISKPIQVVKPVMKTTATTSVVTVPKMTKQISIASPMTISFNVPTGFIKHNDDSLMSQSTHQDFISMWSSNQGAIHGNAMLETSFSGIKNIFNAQNESELFAIVDSDVKRQNAEMISYDSTAFVNTVDKVYITKYNNNIYYIYEVTSKSNRVSGDMFNTDLKQVLAHTKVNGYVVTVHLTNSTNNSTTAMYEFLNSLEVK